MRKTDKSKPIQEGFTIIELLIVMALIAAFSLLVMANYRWGNQQLILDLAANQLAQDLRKVQSWAMAARQFDIGGVMVVPQGYGLYIDHTDTSDPQKYIFFLDNGNGIYDGDTIDTRQETAFLDKNIEIQVTAPSQASVVFFPPDPLSTIKGEGSSWSQATIILRNKYTLATKSVVVYKSGLIYVQ